MAKMVKENGIGGDDFINGVDLGEAIIRLIRD